MIASARTLNVGEGPTTLLVGEDATWRQGRRRVGNGEPICVEDVGSMGAIEDEGVPFQFLTPLREPMRDDLDQMIRA